MKLKAYLSCGLVGAATGAAFACSIAGILPAGIVILAMLAGVSGICSVGLYAAFSDNTEKAYGSYIGGALLACGALSNVLPSREPAAKLVDQTPLVQKFAPACKDAGTEVLQAAPVKQVAPVGCAVK